MIDLCLLHEKRSICYLSLCQSDTKLQWKRHKSDHNVSSRDCLTIRWLWHNRGVVIRLWLWLTCRHLGPNERWDPFTLDTWAALNQDNLWILLIFNKIWTCSWELFFVFVCCQHNPQSYAQIWTNVAVFNAWITSNHGSIHTLSTTSSPTPGPGLSTDWFYVTN